MDWSPQLAPWFEHGSYLAVFIVLVLCGVGLPIPEEVTFLAAGYVTAQIGASPWVMIVVAMAGILVGDSLTFHLGLRYGLALLSRWPFRVLLGPRRLRKGFIFFRRHGSKTVFLAGFLAGVRAPTFFLSGTMGVRYFRFLGMDFARAALTCPISIWAGYAFGDKGAAFLREYSAWVFAAGVLAVLVVLARWARQKRQAGQAPPAEVPQGPPEGLSGHDAAKDCGE